MRVFILTAICGLMLLDLSACGGAGSHSALGGGGTSGINNSGVIAGGGGAGISVTTHPFTGSSTKKK